MIKNIFKNSFVQFILSQEIFAAVVRGAVVLGGNYPGGN